MTYHRIMNIVFCVNLFLDYWILLYMVKYQFKEIYVY